MRVIITAGGTGGHIYPALAIIEKIKKEEPNSDILYIGTHDRMEKDIIPNHGIKYEALEIYGLTKNIIHDIKDLYLIRRAYKKSLKLIKEFKPDIVIGVGGYVTYPVIKAAKKLDVKTLIHEQNAIPGKTNKLISKYADVIAVSFEESAKYFEGKNIVYSGNPTGIKAKFTKEIKKADLGLKKDKLIVIVAGSQGSQTISIKMKEYLSSLQNKNYQVLYITGKNYYDEFKDEKYPENVKVLPYLDNLSGLLKNTDLLVTRAGASTIAEIIALRVPSIFIPSPYVANNHQFYNALNLSEKNCAKMIEEKNLTKESLTKEIEDLLDNEFKYNEIKNNLGKLKTISSDEIIYSKIKELLKNE